MVQGGGGGEGGGGRNKTKQRPSIFCWIGKPISLLPQGLFEILTPCHPRVSRSLESFVVPLALPPIQSIFERCRGANLSPLHGCFAWPSCILPLIFILILDYMKLVLDFSTVLFHNTNFALILDYLKLMLALSSCVTKDIFWIWPIVYFLSFLYPDFFNQFCIKCRDFSALQQPWCSSSDVWMTSLT